MGLGEERKREKEKRGKRECAEILWFLIPVETAVMCSL
jgi:hypothetical protein